MSVREEEIMADEVVSRQVNLMEALRNAAIAKVLALAPEEQAKLNFDPQGRVLIEVSRAELEEVSPGITDNTGYQSGSKDSFLVSYDITPGDELADSLQTKSGIDPDVLAKYLNSPSRSSVIPLHQEMFFHMRGGMRVITEKIMKEQFEGKQADIQRALHAAESALNAEVMKIFSEALAEQSGNDEIDIKALNKKLDAARETLPDLAMAELMKQLTAKTDVIVTKQTLLDSNPEKYKGDVDKLKKDIKHQAESTSATDQDVLVLERQLGIATLIRGTNETAHDRKITLTVPRSPDADPTFAHRQIITHKFDGTVISAHPNPRIQMRTPSTSVKQWDAALDAQRDEITSFGKRPANSYQDTAAKFYEVKHSYQLGDRLQVQGKRPRAFVYNHHTAVNHFLGDLKGNLQTQSAKDVAFGMHIYNSGQVKSDKPVYAFVQNMSVNGRGEPLGYCSWYNPFHINRGLKNDNTLMAEMALMHTLYDSLDEEQQALYGDAIDKYNAFLKTFDPAKPSYFYDSEHGKSARQTIAAIKSSVKAAVHVAGEPTDVLGSAKKALLNMVANDSHLGTHANTKTIQSLSIFLEQASIAGCKSGNERAEAITKRVATLDSLLLLPDESLSAEMKSLRTAIVNVAEDASPKNVAALNKALNIATNKHALQSATTVVSMTDQLSGAKVKPWPDYAPITGQGIFKNIVNAFSNIGTAFKRAYIQVLDTNVAEAEEMTSLVQKHAGDNQAHKGLAGNVLQGVDAATEENKEHVDRSEGRVLQRLGGVENARKHQYDLADEEQRRAERVEDKVLHADHHLGNSGDELDETRPLLGAEEDGSKVRTSFSSGGH